jgi:hypothetical protein
MKHPAATILRAEAITPEGMAAGERNGEFCPWLIRYTYRTFADSPAGLVAARAWAHATDSNGQARINRVKLREDWRSCRRDYWYEYEDEEGEFFADSTADAGGCMAMSERLYKFTDEHRANLSVAHKGHKHTEEHRAKIGAALRSLNLSAIRTGSGNNRWGARTALNQE